jgi:prepilin signal peptidase PulO-like enzyme (type II secretory pathway)
VLPDGLRAALGAPASAALAWGLVGLCTGGFVAWANRRLAAAEQVPGGGGRLHRLGPPVVLAVTFAALGGELGWQFALFPRSLWAALLCQVLFFDLAHRLILDRVLAPAAVAAFGLSFVEPGVGWASSLAAGAGAFCVFGLIAVIGRVALGGEAMGLGDVKLVAFIGLALGIQAAAVAMISGVVLAGIVALVLVLTRLRGLRDSIAYGPYLALGSLLALFLAGLPRR